MLFRTLAVLALVVHAQSPIAQNRAIPAEAAFERQQHASPPIGPYVLGGHISGITGLVEFSAAEYQALHRDVVFENEHIYHAPDATFAGAQWEIVLGVVDGVVYKVSAAAAAPDSASNAARLRETLRFLRVRLGVPSVSHQMQVYVWDTSDGNVVLNASYDPRLSAVVITLTSRAVRGFTRVR